ncbi:disease resistance protein At4g27190-like [Neltuma alba]|uniref:disease resistance protein At4g27190-like n=1 Tax=Neltuma alba TaxID=207710 RepID=UPI0010A3727C|nr:disease resistance protein At4g27190-like [Prosopis alba]
MEVLAAIVGKIAELTVMPIGRQVEYLLFYKGNFKELEKKIEELKERKVRVEHDVEAERRNGREIEDEVQSWQNRVDDTLEEVQKLREDQPRASVRCWKWSFPNLMSRHHLGRKAKKMTFTISELKDEGKFDGGVGYVPGSSMGNLIFATRGSEKLDSRNSVKEEVMLSLADPKISKVGIYGWGGVGKTTPAKEVAKHVKDRKLFDMVAIATISQALDVDRVQDEIAYQLGFHLDEKTSIGRADRLFARIKMEKNVLVILDDLWEKIDLDKLGIPSEQDLKDGKLSFTSKRLDISQKNETYQGCKLLLTSRRLDILQKNETQSNFLIKALDNAESWSLFEEMVGDAIKDADLQNIATQVVERCAGLPVMIVSTAKALKFNKNIHYWTDALNNLKRVDNGDMYGTVFSGFEFTYNRLEDDEMKKVFLLCATCGPSTWVSYLLKLLFGLGALKHIDTIRDARNRLYRIIDDLKASCLLLENDANNTDEIEMHDIVCEIAVSIARKSEHVFALRNDRMQDWPSKRFLERCTQIILSDCFIQELPQKLDCPNLKFFFLSFNESCTLKIPDSFFEGMESLEALDLTGLIIPTLPISLLFLTKLKTLCLDQCTLKNMAGIGDLTNLEILSFWGSYIVEFPSEIGQLTRIKMLDMTKSRIKIIPSNTLSKLTKIEELYMGNASIKWEEESSTTQNKSASLAELGRLTSLTTLEIQIPEAWMLLRDMMFEKLERYKIVIGDKWEWSRNKRALRLLKLKLDTSIHSEHGIKALIKQVEDLYLDEVNGILDVLFDLNGEGFPLLKYLHIQNNGQLQHIINTTEWNETHVLFPKLETLILHNLNNLAKICHGPLPVNSFGKLTIIKVKSCDQLVYLFSVLMEKALSQLVELQVLECSSMKRIVLIENDDSGISSDEKIEFHSLRSLSLCHLPVIHDFCSNESTSFMTATLLFNGTKVSFSSLETLKLSSINLEKIWDDHHLSAANCIQNLTNLIVEDCRGLKHLCSSFVVGSLSKLKHLEISKCDMMEEIIAPDSLATQEVRFTKLETMVVKDMESLKKIWHFQFDKLKSLEVSNCGKLVNIFPSDMQGTFGSLETLTVSSCGSVEEIFESTAKGIHNEDETATQQVSQLKKLHLFGLPKLKQIWSRDAEANLRFLNLQLVRVEYCGNLEYLFPFSISMQATQLERITIKYSGRMKHIVSSNEVIPMDSPVKFEFNHLTSLVFWSLSELEGLYAGKHSLLCPLLRALDVRTCLKLKLFMTQSTRARDRVYDNKQQISMQQPLFALEEVICNLEKLTLNSEDASIILQGQLARKHFSKLKILYLANFEDERATFPYWFLQNITTLNELLVECSSFGEIFQEEIPIQDKGKFKIGTRIKSLTLNQLYHLQHIGKERAQIDPVLEELEYLDVDQCSNLKHLVPSSVTFRHLTYFGVENCNGLIHLMTSSTARSLVKLTTMKIRNCDSLDQVVVAEEREGSEDEIAFSSLQILELECLPMIKRFCSSNCVLNLPSLVNVVVKQCPRMNIFSKKSTSTPMLRQI